MTEKFKVGDLVKVEYEAEVVAEWDDGALTVRVGSDHFIVKNGLLALIEPEIVLDENDGTIVQVDPKNEHNMRSTFAKYPSNGDGDNSLWGSISHGWVDTAELVNWCRMYGYVQYPAVSND